MSCQYFSYFIEIVLVFVRFLCQNVTSSFYFILAFWITIILVLVFRKRRLIILLVVLIFVTKLTLSGSAVVVGHCLWAVLHDLCVVSLHYSGSRH